MSLQTRRSVAQTGLCVLNVMVLGLNPEPCSLGLSLEFAGSLSLLCGFRGFPPGALIFSQSPKTYGSPRESWELIQTLV